MTVSQKKSHTVTGDVFDFLSQHIYSGHWKPGDRLPSESQLCVQLGASRISVRSALSQLSALGLVDRQQGRGTFVKQAGPLRDPSSVLSLQEVDRLSVFEFRKIIEIESAALAAIRASSADVAAMEKSIVTMEESSDPAIMAEQDMLFHFLIAKSSGNDIILQIFLIMQDTYAAMFEDNVDHLGNIGAGQHRKILLDIQTRDMESARRHMLAHLDDTVRLVYKQ